MHSIELSASGRVCFGAGVGDGVREDDDSGEAVRVRFIFDYGEMKRRREEEEG